MSGYQRIPNSNEYPGNAASPVAAQSPAAYPQLNAQVQPVHQQQQQQQQPQQQPQQYYQQQPSPYQQVNYQQQPQQQNYQQQQNFVQPQTVQPSPYYNYNNQGTYAQPQQQQQPQVAYAQAQPVAAQPIYNAYGYPAYAAPVAVAANGENVALLGAAAPTVGMWSDGLFNCFVNGPILLTAWCFPCIRWAQSISRANIMSFWGAFFLYTFPALAVFGISMYFSVAGNSVYVYKYNSYNYGYTYGQLTDLSIALLCVVAACHLFVLILSSVLRAKIRSKYQIQGNGCGDFCIHYWCHCCAIAQEARHVDRSLGITV